MSREGEIKYWYENLSKETLKDIDLFYTKEAYFKDPFNEFNGIKKINVIFQEMFKNLKDPKFVFIDMFASENQIFVTWDFNFGVKGRSFTIHGSSHLKINENGLINYHRDYWDVGDEVLIKLPIIGKLYKLFKNKLSHE